MTQVYRSEDSLLAHGVRGGGWGLFHHAGHGLGSKYLHWMSHLADPLSHFYQVLVAPHPSHLFTHKRGPPAVSFNPFIAYR